jgi:hypothetical protein
MKAIAFPEYSGLRCLMMPFIQGDPSSIPERFHSYSEIIKTAALNFGEVGYLTIDESPVKAGVPQRAARARYGRALHTEVGLTKFPSYAWGGNPWGSSATVTLDGDVRILLANSLDLTCAVWDTVHEDTSADGDIGHAADQYPYSDAMLLKAGELCEIGILTPHESLPVREDGVRQFIRIISSGVHGREPYFTINPLMQ